MEHLSTITPPALVVLVGVAGSGKSTWARERFPGTRVLSSDAMRGMLTDDEAHHGCSRDAFRVLRELADLRLRYGRLAVIDATNLQPFARAPWLELAREHGVPAFAVWFDVAPIEALRRQASRSRRVSAQAIARQAAHLEGLEEALLGEPWEGVWRLRVGGDGEALASEALRAWTPPERQALPGGGLRVRRREVDVVGDVHGCSEALDALLGRLGWTRDGAGGWAHPQGRLLVFVGDLTDRGPASLATLDRVCELVEQGQALLVLGNHDDKLRRYLAGNAVKPAHGLETTVAEWEALDEAARAARRPRYLALLEGAALWVLLDPAEGTRPIPERLVVAHAAWKPSLMGASVKRARAYCIYGPTTGDMGSDGLPERLDWTLDYPADAPYCVTGHTPYIGPVVQGPRACCIDTACVFGGQLTALRWPSREVVQVEAGRAWAARVALGPTPGLIDPASLAARAAAAARPRVDEASAVAEEAARLFPDAATLEAAAAVVERAPRALEPHERFELRLDRLLRALAEPAQTLAAIDRDPLLLHRHPEAGPLSALTIANASQDLFSPTAVHHLYAKGIVYRREPPTLVSLPYVKMYNYREREDAFGLANALAREPGVEVRFNEKLDGTLVQLFSTAGLGLGAPRVVLTTRSMIEGARSAAAGAGFDYLGSARALLERQCPAVLDPARVEGLSLLWELIHPEARVITNYGAQEGLVLTGAVELRGACPRYLPRAELVALAARLGAPLVDELPVEGQGLAERLDALAEWLAGTDREGAVLTFEGVGDEGRRCVLHRVKVKGARYLQLLRWTARCTYERTAALLELDPALRSWPALRAHLMEQGSDEVPEEVLGDYRSHLERWLRYTEHLEAIVAAARGVLLSYTTAQPAPPRQAEGYATWRRAFAAWVKRRTGPDAWLLFAAADGRLDREQLARRLVDPAENEATLVRLRDLLA